LSLSSSGDSRTFLQIFTSFDYSSKAESQNQVKSLPEGYCKPKHSVLFVTTDKTDSSSIQNIFFRYGHKHNLRFALSKRDNQFGHPRMFNGRMFHPEPTLVQHDKSLLSIQNDNPTHGARYNHEKMESIMPADTIFVTILRDPVFSIEYFFSFYNLKQAHHEESAIHFLEDFFSTSLNKSRHPDLLNRRRFGRFERNKMSVGLGLDAKHFDNLEMITKFINTIDSQFHLVMIIDRLEESLIHLQNLLCWTLDDMIVFRHKIQNAHVLHNVSIDLKQKIRSFNNADELLYKHFDAKLNRQTEAFGKTEMEKQIISLQHATNLMYDKCVEKEVPMENIELLKRDGPNYQVPRFKLKRRADKTCRYLTNSQGLENTVLGLYANRMNIKV